MYRLTLAMTAAVATDAPATQKAAVDPARR
jgi:hypothetical protein